MAFVLTNARVFAAGADLTGATNKVEIAPDIKDVDVTTFASGGWSEVAAGLASTKVTTAGLWEAGDPGKVDDAAWSVLGGSGPLTACPDGAAVGGLAYLTDLVVTTYTVGGAVGDAAPFELDGSGSAPVARGQIMHAPGVAETAAGSSPGVQLGAVAAGQSLFAALHVLSVTGTGGPGITVTVESDVDNTFSSPVTVATFTEATAPGGQWVRVPGPVTDTWFRVSWTVAGISPSFLFVAALGVK